MKTIISSWKGSENTANFVRSQIAERFGSEQANIYNPAENCFTYATWKAKGYQVKKGEKSLKSITWIPSKKDKTIKFMKKVSLFFISQVEIINE